jgi:hypothetical protein
MEPGEKLGFENKPNRFKFWWVKKIDGFRPKQTQAIYPSMLSIGYSEIRAIF